MKCSKYHNSIVEAKHSKSHGIHNPIDKVNMLKSMNENGQNGGEHSKPHGLIMKTKQSFVNTRGWKESFQIVSNISVKHNYSTTHKNVVEQTQKNTQL